jgi:hypothetical protein
MMCDCRTADGLTLIATSSDGYASIFTFEEGELGVPSAEQPKRTMGPLEESLVNGVSTLSPTKPAAASTATSPAQENTNGMSSSTSLSKGENVFAVPSAPRAPLQKEDSDVIMLSSEPEGMANSEQPKKVKKRVALTHVGPLGSSA